ncbi:MAG TPA: 3-methyl-2-oxobutanoate hydroxymethyltransferase [Actinomycetota bacterium]|nr:3-methyl-2-oxobutanoate hydroxymethyltransferase [Actinomycetota bacterium]
MPVTVRDLARFKSEGRRFAMLTAYDFPTARILDQAGVPVLLVGDSLGQVVLGYDTTLPVTMDEMLHHCRAVARGAGSALLVGDMPFGSYQVSVEEGIRNAARFLKEGGMHAVKIEGSNLELTQALTERGIPVMAHLGLTPQSVHALGGYRVQARSEEDAHLLASHALELQKAGAFSLVLEAVPSAVARAVTGALTIPTIGIGAGPGCDAQVLVIHDLIGFGTGYVGKAPKFVKRYANVAETIGEAVSQFRRDVEAGTYPDEQHSY